MSRIDAARLEQVRRRLNQAYSFWLSEVEVPDRTWASQRSAQFVVSAIRKRLMALGLWYE